MNTIAEGWQSYECEVLPKGAPPIQLRECRMAFYAGAHWMLKLVADLSELSDDAGVAVLESLHREAMAYADRIVREHERGGS